MWYANLDVNSSKNLPEIPEGKWTTGAAKPKKPDLNAQAGMP